MRVIDLTGRRFDKLVVLGPTNKRLNGQVVWRCLCDCTMLCVVRSYNLRTKRTRSCGCLLKAHYNNTRLSDGEAGMRKLYRIYKRNARLRRVVFELSLKEFEALTADACHYCGTAPKHASRPRNNLKRGCYLYNGIDRKNNEQGYTLSNSVACCTMCNGAKSNRTYQVFVEWLKRIGRKWNDLSDTV